MEGSGELCKSKAACEEAIAKRLRGVTADNNRVEVRPVKPEGGAEEVYTLTFEDMGQSEIDALGEWDGW